MKVSIIVLVLTGLSSPEVANCMRRMAQSEVEMGAGSNHTGYCCCKKARCEEGARNDDDSDGAVYSPNENLCCKLKKWTCTSSVQWSAYRLEKESKYCQTKTPVTDLDSGFKPPEIRDKPRPIDQEDLKAGTPGHTVHNYCDFSAGAGADEGDAEGGADEGKEGHDAKLEVVRSLVKELAKNSIDTMAKDIFSLYLCVRWAPDASFVEVAKGEIKTNQLSNSSTPLEHYQKFHFMPLRCTKNVNVYGGSPKLGDTHFDHFEAEMMALSKWYHHEKKGALAKRLAKMTAGMQSKRNYDLASESKAFDVAEVQKAVNKCGDNNSQILVNTFESSAVDLLADCGAAKWWLSKLKDWQKAMPFETFMIPSKEAAAKAAPEADEQVLVCFGKRVASQLHRREKGKHLITDQSAVGCHGFWDLGKAAQMLDRIVMLWRPPTCQLAAMELDMKVKIMELIANMNANLFDALPAMLVEEMTEGGDWDGKQLEASSGLGMMRGVWTSIISSFGSLKGKYVRLGELLGNTVVKWVVCPLKPITNATKLDLLDQALGTEDDLARYYAEIAYSKWAEKKNLLPGELCVYPTEVEGGNYGLTRTKQCSLGEMREDMPEPYKDEKFICPIRPLLPAKQQLDIFKKKRDWCTMHMNSEQMKIENWFYRGRTPHRKQYNATENIPKDSYQYAKILSTHSRPDTDFGIWRNFVTIGRGCTEKEAATTPRWCKAPEVANPPSGINNLLSGVGLAAGLVGSGAGAIGEATGLTDKSIGNQAFQERLGTWWFGQMKGVEASIKNSWNGWVGKAATRYNALYKKSFAEIEAGELLHSASFQKKLAQTGADSQDLQQFDRFGVVCPCVEFEPEREFDLKYKWAEKALIMARKGHQKFKEIVRSKAFTVEFRGSGVLNMKNEENAWMNYFAHLRAAAIDKEMPMWVPTKNTFILELVGEFGQSSYKSVKATDLKGFEAFFACGTRRNMHDLSLKSADVTSADSHLDKDFLTCVKEGVNTNEQLKKSNPSEDFLKDEVVVRVVLAELKDCYHETNTSGMKFSNETKNPVFKSFMSVSGCKAINKAGLPQDLKDAKDSWMYRGMLLGKGLPDNTLVEVLVNPADVIDELHL